DRMHDYLSWPVDDLDPHRLAAQTQVIRVIAVVAAKVGDEARSERDRQRALGHLIRAFEEAARECLLGDNGMGLLGENWGLRGGMARNSLSPLRPIHVREQHKLRNSP